MGGDGTKQGAFSWPPSRNSPAQGPRPEAPPRAGAGGARGASRRETGRAERVRALDVVVTAPLPPDNELWDVRAAARFLRRSVSWVYHRAEDGTLPVKRLGGWGLRFVPGELRAWVDHGGAAKRG